MPEPIVIILSIVGTLIVVGAIALIVSVFRRNIQRALKVGQMVNTQLDQPRNISSPVALLDRDKATNASVTSWSFQPTYRHLLEAADLWTKARLKDKLTVFDKNIFLYQCKYYPNSSHSKIEKIIEEKKEDFLNIPSVSFHYANDELIKDFYNNYFREPTIENLVSEITGEVNGEIKGSLPQVLQARIGTSDLNKWVSTIKLPDASLNGMFLRFQRETIKNNQVVLGIEEVDIELTELEAFEDAIDELRGRFGLEIEEDILDKQRAILKEKAAERTLVKLEQAKDWVLIEGKFKIENDDDFYRCTYLHPVNSYLSNQVGPVTISVLIPKNSLKEHIKGNYAQSIGRSIPLKIYGQVWQPIERRAGVWDLQLTPLAIY